MPSEVISGTHENVSSANFWATKLVEAGKALAAAGSEFNLMAQPHMAGVLHSSRPGSVRVIPVVDRKTAKHGCC